MLRILDRIIFHYFFQLIFRLAPLTSAAKISQSKIMQHSSYFECHLIDFPCYIGMVDFIQADYYALNAARLGVALNASRPAITIPLVGKTLVQVSIDRH